MPIPKVDYHTHTPLCGHATGRPVEYVQTAIEVGLREIGFSDHAPLVAYPDPRYTMSHDQLPQYHAMVKEVQDLFPNFPIKLGIEADYIPGFESQTKQILDAYPYDFVIGSIHFIDAWPFDDPDQQIRWKEKDIDRVYKDYYELLQKSAQSKLFDIMGHVDLVKKFGHRPTVDISDLIHETAQIFHESGVVVEINSSGLRKPVKEVYPSLDAIKIYHEHRVPITFSSDAHDPSDVGRDYAISSQMAQAAGYRQYAVLEKRRIVDFWPL